MIGLDPDSAEKVRILRSPRDDNKLLRLSSGTREPSVWLWSLRPPQKQPA
jgi:hypothetical protein